MTDTKVNLQYEETITEWKHTNKINHPKAFLPDSTINITVGCSLTFIKRKVKYGTDAR